MLAAKAYLERVMGQTLEGILADFRGFYHKLAQDPMLRWVGPEKGVTHMALGAVINAFVWDPLGPAGKETLWKLLADFSPPNKSSLPSTSPTSPTSSRPKRPWPSP